MPNLADIRRVVTARSLDIAMTTLSRRVKEKVTEMGDSMVDGPLKRPHESEAELVLNVSVKSRGSIYDPLVLLFDTAATAHLIRNPELFEGALVPINDQEVSFLGFDTEQGHEFPVSVGTLKYPLEGVSAYFAPNCVGNIISEPLLRSEGFKISFKRSRESRDDTVMSSRP